MRTMQDWFDEYGESHQNPTNKLIHWVCVPLIFFSIVGLLMEIPLGGLPGLFPAQIAPHVHLGTALLVFGLLFYLRISLPMALGMLLVAVVMLTGNYALRAATAGMLAYWQVCALIFVGSWIGQFYGHKLEGKKPSFIKDVQFLMIGPAWLLGFIYRSVGLRY